MRYKNKINTGLSEESYILSNKVLGNVFEYD